MKKRRRKYIGQCDRLRHESVSNEKKWQAMMSCAKRVTAAMFLENVDIADLLDENETEREWIADQVHQDPTTGFYQSWWGSDRAWFIQTAGFEFIFLDREAPEGGRR